MKELQLKYGCNPNQKPSRIYMNGLEVYVTYEVLESIGTNEKIVF